MQDRLQGTFRRRRLSMTALIDVIFLLLLFFMLSSTFARQGELTLDLAMGGATALPDTPPLFLQLGAQGLRLNGQDATPETLQSALADDTGGLVLVAMAEDVSAQALAEILHLINRQPGWRVAVIGSGA
jgi:biopolymer transport protein ExbD